MLNPVERSSTLAQFIKAIIDFFLLCLLCDCFSLLLEQFSNLPELLADSVLWLQSLVRVLNKPLLLGAILCRKLSFIQVCVGDVQRILIWINFNIVIVHGDLSEAGRVGQHELWIKPHFSVV